MQPFILSTRSLQRLSRPFFALAATVLAVGAAVMPSPAQAADTQAPPAGVQLKGSPTSPEQKSLLVQMQDAFTSIANTAEPFVVNITAEHPVSGLEGDLPLRPEAPGLRSPHSGPGGGDVFPRQAQATGSGVIVRPDGYILTNDHVVDGAPYVTVTLSDGREYRGRVFPDFRSDLAIVKIDPGTTPLPVATFADSDSVEPGQWAIAIGSPFDLQNTMTVGVISATKRHQLIGDDPDSARYYPDLMQTDAAINPGNSGGPLLNIDGKVIGINVAIESPVEGSAGVGFAIPSRIAQEVMAELIQSGKVIRGYLGLAPSDLTPFLRQEYGATHGVWVQSVDEDSPAGRAGIHAADVVVSYDGQPVDSELSLREAISDTTPGKSVGIDLLRDGQPMSIHATISAPPQDSTAPPPSNTQPPRTFGVAVRTLSASDRSELGFDPSLTGAIVVTVDPNSPAASAEPESIMEKDVIEQVGETKITTAAEAIKALSNIEPGGQVTVRVIRSNSGKLKELALQMQAQE